MKSGAQHPDHTRRAFLRGAFLTRAGREDQEHRQQPWGPPPPWHAGRRIAADSCYDCDAPCVSACEPSIIRRYPLDHVSAGLPYLAFDNGGCNFCGACADACPMDLNKTEEQPILGKAILNKQSCLAWNGIVCINCRSHCEANALSLDRRGRVQVDDEACTGCGRCVSVCPNDALAISGQ